MPLAPSSKPVKSGGWIAWSESSKTAYAAKGNKTGDFYSLRCLDSTWATLAPIPPGEDGKLPYKGCRGVYDGHGRIYMTIGSNTRTFLCFDISANSWTELEKLPPQPSGDFARAGADMVFVTRNDSGYVYLLKGTNPDFCRYNTLTDRWTVLPSAPAGVKPKYAEGSWLVFDGDHTIYCHKAKYHELWRYDVAADRWLDTVLPGMPLVGMMARTKKSKDGGCAAFINGRILALKGGNTQEFWCFNPETRAWDERETIPKLGSTGRNRKVKAGADIATAGVDMLFALKGNKTCELWRYEEVVEAQAGDPCPPGIAVWSAAGPQTGRAAEASTPGQGVLTARDITGRLAWRGRG
ncbi:hypothetical protein FJY71_01010, partial [candidate division WOR-3 bacterium]|nr:hypothetical protein [candidate division WOR-3 bacterium]